MQATNFNNAFECPVCMERYNDSDHAPKVLPCGHSCCMVCTKELFAPKNSITCPICRSVSNIPPTSLPTNYGILNAMPPLTTPVIVQECSMCKHTKRPVVMHCETCNVLLCLGHSETHQDDNEDHAVHEILLKGHLSFSNDIEKGTIVPHIRPNTSEPSSSTNANGAIPVATTTTPPPVTSSPSTVAYSTPTVTRYHLSDSSYKSKSSEEEEASQKRVNNCCLIMGIFIVMVFGCVKSSQAYLWSVFGVCTAIICFKACTVDIDPLICMYQSMTTISLIMAIIIVANK